jgi:hypothetical protein
LLWDEEGGKLIEEKKAERKNVEEKNIEYYRQLYSRE